MLFPPRRYRRSLNYNIRDAQRETTGPRKICHRFVATNAVGMDFQPSSHIRTFSRLKESTAERANLDLRKMEFYLLRPPKKRKMRAFGEVLFANFVRICNLMSAVTLLFPTIGSHKVCSFRLQESPTTPAGLTSWLVVLPFSRFAPSFLLLGTLSVYRPRE